MGHHGMSNHWEPLQPEGRGFCSTPGSSVQARKPAAVIGTFKSSQSPCVVSRGWNCCRDPCMLRGLQSQTFSPAAMHPSAVSSAAWNRISKLETAEGVCDTSSVSMIMRPLNLSSSSLARVLSLVCWWPGSVRATVLCAPDCSAGGEALHVAAAHGCCVLLYVQMKWNQPEETGGEDVVAYHLQMLPAPQGFELPPDEQVRAEG